MLSWFPLGFPISLRELRLLSSRAFEIPSRRECSDCDLSSYEQYTSAFYSFVFPTSSCICYFVNSLRAHCVFTSCVGEKVRLLPDSKILMLALGFHMSLRDLFTSSIRSHVFYLVLFDEKNYEQYTIACFLSIFPTSTCRLFFVNSIRPQNIFFISHCCFI